MTKRVIMATIAVFIAWSILDFLIHGVLLQSIYAVTSHLWRPMDQMNRPVARHLGGRRLFCDDLRLADREEVLGVGYPVWSDLWPRLGRVHGLWLLQLYADTAFARIQLVHRKLDRSNCGWCDRRSQ